MVVEQNMLLSAILPRMRRLEETPFVTSFYVKCHKEDFVMKNMNSGCRTMSEQAYQRCVAFLWNSRMKLDYIVTYATLISKVFSFVLI